MVKISKLLYSDLDFLNKVRNQCAEKFLHDSRIFTLDETQKWFRLNNPDYYIIEFENSKLGYFRTSNWDLDKKTIYIGCDIEEGYRGLGYGFISYKEFIPFIFDKYQVEEILLEVLENNYVAKNLYRKLGFSFVKNTEPRVDKSGESISSELMSLKKNKWLH